MSKPTFRFNLVDQVPYFEESLQDYAKRTGVPADSVRESWSRHLDEKWSSWKKPDVEATSCEPVIESQ